MTVEVAPIKVNANRPDGWYPLAPNSGTDWLRKYVDSKGNSEKLLPWVHIKGGEVVNVMGIDNSVKQDRLNYDGQATTFFQNWIDSLGGRDAVAKAASKAAIRLKAKVPNGWYRMYGDGAKPGVLVPSESLWVEVLDGHLVDAYVTTDKTAPATTSRQYLGTWLSMFPTMREDFEECFAKKGKWQRASSRSGYLVHTDADGVIDALDWINPDSADDWLKTQSGSKPLSTQIKMLAGHANDVVVAAFKKGAVAPIPTHGAAPDGWFEIRKGHEGNASLWAFVKGEHITGLLTSGVGGVPPRAEFENTLAPHRLTEIGSEKAVRDLLAKAAMEKAAAAKAAEPKPETKTHWKDRTWMLSDGWHLLGVRAEFPDLNYWAHIEAGKLTGTWFMSKEGGQPTNTSAKTFTDNIRGHSPSKMLEELQAKGASETVKKSIGSFPGLEDGWHMVGEWVGRRDSVFSSEDLWVHISQGLITSSWFVQSGNRSGGPTDFTGHFGTEADPTEKTKKYDSERRLVSPDVADGWYDIPGGPFTYTFGVRHQNACAYIQDGRIVCIAGGAADNLEHVPTTGDRTLLFNSWVNSLGGIEAAKTLLLNNPKIKAAMGARTEAAQKSETKSEVGLGTAAGAAALLIFGGTFLKKAAERQRLNKRAKQEAQCQQKSGT